MKQMNPLRRHQPGLVLAVILILISILTVLGIASTNSATIQILLARNTQMKEMSFHNAESALAIGEAEWLSVVDRCLAESGDCRRGIYPPASADISGIDWQEAAAAESPDGSVTYGKYFVEYLGWRPLPGENRKRLLVYRITSQGVGPNAQTRTLVQSLFGICIDSDGLRCAGSPVI